MSDTTRVIKPAAEELPTDLVDLIQSIGQLDAEARNRLEPLLSRVVESTKRRRRIMNLVQDALSQLRLDMKYLLFDLEATRRERDEYKAQLDGNDEI
jgi:hypothetical protein